MKDQRRSKIYALYDPRQPKIFRYIGVTRNSVEDRLNSHIRAAQNALCGTIYCTNWIRSILKDDIFPRLKIIEEVDLKNGAGREIFWIRRYTKSTGKLTNLTKGGDGVVGFNKGKPKSEITRRKMSESHKGKILSEKTKLKMSASKLKIFSGRFGIALRRRIGESNKRTWKRCLIEISPDEFVHDMKLRVRK